MWAVVNSAGKQATDHTLLVDDVSEERTLAVSLCRFVLKVGQQQVFDSLLLVFQSFKTEFVLTVDADDLRVEGFKLVVQLLQLNQLFHARRSPMGSAKQKHDVFPVSEVRQTDRFVPDVGGGELWSFVTYL